MKLKRVAVLYIAIALVVVASTAGCAGNKHPETTVAQGATTVLQTLTALQKNVTANTEAGKLDVAVARKITNYVDLAQQQAPKLSDALKAYHTATSVDLKHAKAAEVQQLIVDLNSQVQKVLGESLPPGVVSELTQLAGNVLGAVASVQLEFSKNMTGGK